LKFIKHLPFSAGVSPKFVPKLTSYGKMLNDTVSGAARNNTVYDDDYCDVDEDRKYIDYDHSAAEENESIFLEKSIGKFASCNKSFNSNHFRQHLNFMIENYICKCLS